MTFDNEYVCPNCGAILNEQYGFDPDNDTWTCTSCGKELYGDNVYEGEQYPGVMWYCDECGALLNKQDGFYDYCYSWFCTECGHENPINDSEIYESTSDYEESRNNSGYTDNNDDDRSDYSSRNYSQSDSESYRQPSINSHDGVNEEKNVQNSSNSGCCLVNLFSGCLGMILLFILGLIGLWLVCKVLLFGFDIIDWIF